MTEDPGLICCRAAEKKSRCVSLAGNQDPGKRESYHHAHSTQTQKETKHVTTVTVTNNSVRGDEESGGITYLREKGTNITTNV